MTTRNECDSVYTNIFIKIKIMNHIKRCFLRANGQYARKSCPEMTDSQESWKNNSSVKNKREKVMKPIRIDQIALSW
jgi:hypothetical protein